MLDSDTQVYGASPNPPPPGASLPVQLQTTASTAIPGNTQMSMQLPLLQLLALQQHAFRTALPGVQPNANSEYFANAAHHGASTLSAPIPPPAIPLQMLQQQLPAQASTQPTAVCAPMTAYAMHQQGMTASHDAMAAAPLPPAISSQQYVPPVAGNDGVPELLAESVPPPPANTTQQVQQSLLPSALMVPALTGYEQLVLSMQVPSLQQPGVDAAANADATGAPPPDRSQTHHDTSNDGFQLDDDDRDNTAAAVDMGDEAVDETHSFSAAASHASSWLQQHAPGMQVDHIDISQSTAEKVCTPANFQLMLQHTPPGSEVWQVLAVKLLELLYANASKPSPHQPAQVQGNLACVRALNKINSVMLQLRDVSSVLQDELAAAGVQAAIEQPHLPLSDLPQLMSEAAPTEQLDANQNELYIEQIVGDAPGLGSIGQVPIWRLRLDLKQLFVPDDALAVCGIDDPAQSSKDKVSKQ